MTFVSPRQKMARISKNPKQLWVVAYVNQEGKSPLLDEALRDLDACVGGGADAVLFINEWCSLKELEETIAGVRQKHPNIPLGVNYLGDEKEPYGFRDSFRLAREYNLQVVWTDFVGVDLINEKPPVDLHVIQSERPESVFYCSGVHMKYSTLKDPTKPVELSALQAMGWVDGVIVTGPKTGVACNPETARRAKAAIGDYPLGVASGVSAANVHEIRDQVEFYIVASSLQNEHKRIVKEKVSELARKIHG